jgi:diguanylate cyclase (GGDEF)-like protein
MSAEWAASTPQRKAWPIKAAPRRLVTYGLSVELATTLTLLLVVQVVGIQRVDLPRAFLILGLAVAFEEIAGKAARMRVLLSGYLKPDMTSVWCLASALALRPLTSAATVVCLIGYMWFRHWRPSGIELYRRVFSGATIIMACLFAHFIMDSTASHLPSGVGIAAGAATAIVAYGATNRLLVMVWLVIGGVPLRDLLGSPDDNLLEAATLCLGTLVALAVIYQPLMAALVLLPMVLLQRGALVRQLEVAATTDAKTGLLNAVAWEQIAQRDLARAVREGQPLSVLIIDVDRFKTVNDLHGHLAGDIVLKAMGDTLTHELRGYDTVGRFGGEEFVATLPNVHEDVALRIAERVRSRVNEIRISNLVDVKNPENDRLLAVSIGVACSPTDGTDLTELLHAADAALYVAKGSGRNRVELADRGTGGQPETVTLG